MNCRFGYGHEIASPSFIEEVCCGWYYYYESYDIDARMYLLDYVWSHVSYDLDW